MCGDVSSRRLYTKRSGAVSPSLYAETGYRSQRFADGDYEFWQSQTDLEESGHHNATPQKISELINAVNDAASTLRINMNLYQGNEILYFEDMCSYIDSGKISRMNGTNHILVEFMPSDPYQYIRNSIDEIIGEGYYPIIAHIERYACMVADIDNIREIKHMGAQIQVNASSKTIERT